MDTERRLYLRFIELSNWWENYCHFTGEITEFYYLSKSSNPRLRRKTGPHLITETVILLHCTARMVSKCSLATMDSWSHSAPCRWQLCADLFQWRVKREGEVSRRWQQSEWEAGPWGWMWPSRKSCSGILNVSEEQLLSLPKFLLPSRIVSPNKGCNSNPKIFT